MIAEDMRLAPEYVMRDNDAKFSAPFDEVLTSSGGHCETQHTTVAEKHLDHVRRVRSRHYNEERTRSFRDFLPPDITSPPDEAPSVRVNDLVCTSKLGGLINSYSRRAA